MKFILLISLAIISVSADDANDKDVAKWKGQGEQNAKQDLDKWPQEINDKAQLCDQLKKLKAQIDDAADNMDLVVPVLGKVASTINALGGGDSTNWFKGKGLQAVVAILYGKRDNKSYYLLDGAHSWIEQRKGALKGKNDQLAQQLEELDQLVVKDRDTLDKAAHDFVTPLNEIHDLTGDTKGNADKIKELANKMYNDFQRESPELLKVNKELKDKVAELVKNCN